MGELDGWRHCPRCASDLAHEERSVRCESCGLVAYAKPSPAVCALVLDADGRVLLGRRAYEPGAGLWDILGGFVEEDEDPLDARELVDGRRLVPHGASGSGSIVASGSSWPG